MPSETPSFCAAPMLHNDGRAALARLKKRLAAGPLSPQEGAELIDAASQFSLEPAAKSIPFARMVVESGCFNGSRIDGLTPNPLDRALLVKLPSASREINAHLWAELAIDIALQSAPSPDGRRANRTFTRFLASANPRALPKALQRGAAVAPPLPEIQRLMFDSLAHMTKSNPARSCETLLLCGFALPEMPPARAAELLRDACSLDAGREICSALIQAAGPLLTQESLIACVELNASAPSSTHRPIGSLLKHPGWDPAARELHALKLCRRALERSSRTANSSSPALFSVAAGHCSWGPLSEKVGKTFGASFLAKLERQALTRVAPSHAEPRGDSPGDSPARSKSPRASRL